MVCGARREADSEQHQPEGGRGGLPEEGAPRAQVWRRRHRHGLRRTRTGEPRERRMFNQIRELSTVLCCECFSRGR